MFHGALLYVISPDAHKESKLLLRRFSRKTQILNIIQ